MSYPICKMIYSIIKENEQPIHATWLKLKITVLESHMQSMHVVYLHEISE